MELYFTYCQKTLVESKEKMAKRRVVLYLTYNLKNNFEAQYINSLRRYTVLKKIGFKVVIYDVKNWVSNFFELLRLIKTVDFLLIRVDGSGYLEKFSLLKLFNMKVKLLWEVHGSQQEKRVIGGDSETLIQRKISRTRILSHLVDAYFSVSEELKKFCFEKDHFSQKMSFVIPNFIEGNEAKKKVKKNSDIEILNPSLFKVIWVGNPFYKWHGLDIIEMVAKKIYKIDGSILFIITGGESWYDFSWSKNLLLIQPLKESEMAKYIDMAEVCLAIYKDIPFFPSYFFPLKILSYFSQKKAVIATDTSTIRIIIFDRKNGLLTDNTVDDIVNKILSLKKDSLLRRNLGRNGQKTIAEKFSLKVATNLYKSAFAALES